MRVLVTGSTGAVGRRACARLAEAGHEVVGVDRFSSVRPAPGVDIVTADLAVTDLRRLVDDVDTVVHLASSLRPQLARVDPGHAIPAVAQRLLAALEDSPVTHLVVLSTAMVYGAWPDNPVPLTEEAEVRPCPNFRFAVRRTDLEERAMAWGCANDDRVVTMLRPAVTVAEEKPGGLARLLSAAVAIRSEEGDPMGQFLHADDLAEAVVVAVDQRPLGPLNVAPDGWIPAPLMAELGGQVPRLRLPAGLAGAVARLRWSLGLTEAPPGILPYTVYPWVVSNDRIRSLGWEPRHTNEEAYVAGHEPGALDQLDARSRQLLSLGAAAALLTGFLAGLVWLVRRVTGASPDR
tara:strand:+ start:1147 stop:2193 length:1047 start_codon:yes stop_codon:yes gene_type:complete